MASLNSAQKRLPKVEADRDENEGATRYTLYTVIWDAPSNDSVVVDTYEVDSYTGDVFSAVVSCSEEANPELRALQARVRASLRLSHAEYRRLKTRGPLCEEGYGR
jgi:hypothetical protein